MGNVDILQKKRLVYFYLRGRTQNFAQFSFMFISCVAKQEEDSELFSLLFVEILCISLIFKVVGVCQTNNYFFIKFLTIYLVPFLK